MHFNSQFGNIFCQSCSLFVIITLLSVQEYKMDLSFCCIILNFNSVCCLFL